MRYINRSVIAYLIISVVSLGAAFLFFKGAGSFAEVIGPENKALGFSFRAGGAIAGFIIIFILSQKAVLNFDRNIKDPNPEINSMRKEFLRIMYDPGFLSLMSNQFKETAWKNVTRSINNSFYTQVNEEIANVVFKKLVPQVVDLYHKDCEVYYTIKETDDKSHIEIVELLCYKVIPSGGQIRLDLFEIVQGLDEPGDISDLKFTRLLVNGKDYLPSVPDPQITCNNGMKKIVLDWSLEIEEFAEEYSIIKEVRTVHTRKLNIYWRRTIQKYTYSFQIEIQEDKQIEVDLTQVGQVIDFKPIGQQVNRYLQRHEGLLVPGDGYIIFVK